MAVYTFVVIAALFCACFAQYDPNAIERASEKCRSGTSITRDLVEDILRNQNQDDLEDDMKCYFKCVLQEADWMQMDGVIIPDAGHERLFDCANGVYETEQCDRAYSFAKCVYNQFPETPVL